MPELPDRPDLDQLRRQARELLRAAADGQPHAVARLRAVSDRVTLSVAQLALAREYGFPSWTALRTEAERRRRLVETGRWSFGGATAIETAAGTLTLGALVSGPDQATLAAWLLPTEQTRALMEQAPVDQLNAALLMLTAEHQTPGFDDLTITDDRDTNYILRLAYLTIPFELSGQVTRLDLRLLPAPARECAWLELRNRDGATTRLWPAKRSTARVGVPTPVSGSPAERELSQQAMSVIDIYLSWTDEDVLRQYCAAAIAKVAEVRGRLDTASELPDQLIRLCAALCEQQPTDGLPPAWSGMLDAARRTDGPDLHLDIAAALPPIADTEVQADVLISEPDSWRLHLRARPGWWLYSADRRQKWTVLSVRAEDNLGGMYLGSFGGSSSGRDDYEDVAVRFLPRLDPLARTVKLIFSGTDEQVSLDLRLEPAARP